MRTASTKEPGTTARSSLQTAPRAASAPRGMVWSARALIALLVLFLLVDGGARVVGFAPYVEGTVQAGYPAHFGPGIGMILIACTILYLVPRTAVLGAILLTAYLGGATASNLRGGMPILFPVVFGVLVWGALYVLDARLRALIPLRSQPTED